MSKLTRLIDFLTEHRGLCDEISFFTESDGNDFRYIPMEEVQARAKHVARAVQSARAAGFGTAVNVLNTMGHSDEGGAPAPLVPWRTLVGANGAISRDCSCPRDVNFLAYCTSKYAAYAMSGADKYWIDDDVRVANHRPVDWGCFCSTCLLDFGAVLGVVHSRTQLLDVLRADPTVRSAWLNFSDQAMSALIAACARGVAESSPRSSVGFMTTGAQLDGGGDLKRWFESMDLENGRQQWIRPGGGFWSDDDPRSMLRKIALAGISRETVPAALATYEIENYPFLLGSKSAYITGLEALVAAVSTRLDGVMFDVLDQSGNSLDEFDGWFDLLGAWAPSLVNASELTKSRQCVGWSIAVSGRHLHNSLGSEPIHADGASLGAPSVQLVGVPITSRADLAMGHILDGPAAEGFDREGLRELLERPLVMDGRAAMVFIRHGMGNDIGVSTVEAHSQGVYETFTNHALNGSDGGFARAVTLAYFGEESYVLQPCGQTEIISEMFDYSSARIGAGFTLSQVKGKAPVAVMGHLPWRHISSGPRARQLRSVFHVLAGHQNTIQIDASYRPTVLWTWRGVSTSAAFILNAGFDNSKIEVALDSESVIDVIGLGPHEPQTPLYKYHESGLTLEAPKWSLTAITYRP